MLLRFGLFYGRTAMIASNSASVNPWPIRAALIACTLFSMGGLGAASGPWQRWQLFA
jgi:hypothetical protein